MSEQTSKYKNCFGNTNKYKFTDVKLSTISSEGKQIAVNSSFLALTPDLNEGCSIMILDPSNPTRVSTSIPYIKTSINSHVFDLKFSPFRSDLLASGLENGEIKLWQIPEGGLKENLTKEIQLYKGHCHKIGMVEFNPVASDVIGSCSAGKELQVWNMLKGESYVKYNLEDTQTSLGWNENGSLLGVQLRNRKTTIFDPRLNKGILNNLSDKSSKLSKFSWINNEQFITTNYELNNRVVKLWDIKKIKEDLSTDPIEVIKIDSKSNYLKPYYDFQSKLLFLYSKGETYVNTVDFNYSIPKKGNSFTLEQPFLAECICDRRMLDYNKNEIDKFAGYSNNKEITFISFNILKKDSQFDINLYPPLPCGEPALTYDEWVSGQNKEPVKKIITEIENKFVTKNVEFVKNENVVKEEKKMDEKQKMKELEDKIIILETKNNALISENNYLKKKLEECNNKIKHLEEKLNSCPNSSQNQEELQTTTKEQPKQEESQQPEVQEQPKQEESQQPEVQEQPKQEETQQPEVQEQPKQEETQQPEVQEQPKQEETQQKEVQEQPKQEETQQPEVQEQPKQEETQQPELQEQPKQEETQQPEVQEQPKQEESQQPEVQEQPKQEETNDSIPVSEEPKPTSENPIGQEETQQ